MAQATEIDWGKETNGSGDREVHEAGTYKVQCKNWEECEASTGTKQIRWFDTIVEPKASAGKTIVDHTALSEKALWRLATRVQSFGVDMSEGGKMVIGSPAFKKVLDAVKGRTAFLTITKDEQYNNNKVDSYAADPSAEIEVPTVDVAEDSQAPF